ncbi:YopX family protein [Psychrobacillus sp. FSL K6-1415]|uniref:YopX family protein n=1 Tax=Psychrobacillus sp. FSL K6-1415 TaxID=2921544 RepID=UPI0030F5AB91
MREIKFRAWETGEEIMHPNVTNGVYQDPDEIIDFDFVLGLERFKVMQYTGLKDKDGTEIFEGDIVSTDLSRPFLIVEFRNGAFMYQCHHNGQDYYDFMEPSYEEIKEFTKYHKVIGNIYENPELLEVEANA